VRKLPRDTMTARERIEATLHGELPGRVPVFDLIQNPPLIEHVTGEKVTLRNGLDLLCRTIGQCLDATRGISPPVAERSYRGTDGFAYRQESWTTWLLERPFKDVGGLLEFVRREIDAIRDRKPGDIWGFHGRGSTFGPDGRSPRRRFMEIQERIGENTVLFPTESGVGLDIAVYRAGIELFVYAYAEEPRLVSDWLEAHNWAEIQRVHETADPALTPVALVYADIADKNQTLLPPAFLRREFFPRLARLVAAWHECGVKVIFHSDGNLWPVLPDFQAMEVDGLTPLEPLSGMYAGDVRDKYPNWVLMGGIDASQLLPFGSEAEVRGSVRSTIAGAGPQGRYWLGSSTEIHPACKLANVLAMWDEAERVGYYEGRPQ